MRVWLQSGSRLASGLVFVLASVYCLLAFLPYTYFALIKFPAYSWMPWCAAHFAGIYFAAVLLWIAGAILVGGRNRAPWQRAGFLSIAVIVSAYLVRHAVLRDIGNNAAAFWWSLGMLVPLAGLAELDLAAPLNQGAHPKNEGQSACSFPAGIGGAMVVGLCYSLAAHVERFQMAGALSLGRTGVTLTVWTLVSHALVAIVGLGLVHGIAILASRLPHPRGARRLLLGLAVWGGLWILLSRTLNTMLSFGGWRAELYAASLGLALTIWGWAVVWPLLGWARRRAITGEVQKRSWHSTIAPVATLAASAAIVLLAPRAIGGSDWNGLLRNLLTCIFWIVAVVCVYTLWPKRRASYSAVQVLAMLLLGAGVYGGLRATEIFWSRALGSTDDEISLALTEYGGHDASFGMINSLLGNTRQETCGDLCRILREYTNVRDAHTVAEVHLTRDMVPTTGLRPNIFLFVIDSMRPDYLGAYNSKVDYTPNLDALARDGIVMHNAYTQYAGTSLSEPAIWAGATLLHAHYLQPFARVNSLDRMLKTDGYRRIVSRDEILSEILPPDPGITLLDADNKLWNELEIGSTLQQARTALDQAHGEQPIFFYTQPKNVHQFARNNVPSPSAAHWAERPGLNTRITYEVHWVDERLGEFVAYLKQRGLYDNSIIIVTSDHGDATGEFGRTSHSTSIWPETMRVPLIVRLPRQMREHLVYDDSRVASLTDITPTLYYLLGHTPIEANPLYGRPLFTKTRAELDSYPQRDLLLASDVRAVYGVLAQNGRYLYVTYDSPAQSYLFDLASDPNALRNLLNPSLKQSYDQEIIEHLHQIASFYGYQPGVDSLLAATSH